MNLDEFKEGWRLLLACFIGVGISLPSLYVYTSGIWINSWQNEFGWSRGAIGIGQGLVYLILVLGTPFVGILIDRFGFKNIGVLSLVLYGSCFFLFSLMNGSLFIFYLLSILIAFTALPSTPVGFTKTIHECFEVNRGLALGITLSAIGLGAIILPKYLTPYVASQGWRKGFIILFLITFISTPLVWYLWKKSPNKSSIKNVVLNNEITYSEAIKTKIFWQLGLIFFLISSAVLGLIPNFIPMLLDEGLSATKAGELMAVLGASVVIGRILTGFLLDRYFAPHVAILVFALSASGCLVLGYWQTKFVLWGAITIGLVIGAEVDLVSFFSVKYFGVKNYGTIFGMLYSIFVCGAVISPILIGYSWDITGNYNLAYILAAVIIFSALIITAFLPKFPKPTQK